MTTIVKQMPKKITLYVNDKTSELLDRLMKTLPERGVDLNDHTGVPRLSVLLAWFAEQEDKRQQAEKGGKETL